MTVKTVNGVRYVIDLVSRDKWPVKCPYPMKAKKVTLHNADNDVPASSEAGYHNRNNNQVSFHLVADEKEVRQLLPFDRNGWHSGDGLNGYGNRNTIAMEFARNYDRARRTTNLKEPLKSQYAKAEENGIRVLAQVMIDEGIVANDANIKTHNNWNGKWCPRKILNEKRLQSVKKRLIKEYSRLTKSGEPVAPQVDKPKPKPDKPKVTGGSVVNYMNSKGMDSSYNNRAKLAKQHGINNYRGTASQNVELLNKLRSGNKPKPGPKPRGRKLHLPATAKTWRIYSVNGPYTARHAIHLLTPSAFVGGITYDILEDKGNHIYIINTGVKGRVAIYAAPSTGARIT